MKNYKISYADKAYTVISTTTQEIAAETIDQALKAFTKKHPNPNYPNVVIDPGLSEPNKYDSNPNYKEEKAIQDRPKNTTQEGQQNKSSVLETLATPNFEKANPTTDSETLRTIMLIQAKQLYWIRIIGIPFLCSAGIVAIYMVFQIFK